MKRPKPTKKKLSTSITQIKSDDVFGKDEKHIDQKGVLDGKKKKKARKRNVICNNYVFQNVAQDAFFSCLEIFSAKEDIIGYDIFSQRENFKAYN